MAGFTLIIHYKMGVLKTQVIEHFTRDFRKELGHQWWCWWVPVGRLRRAPKELRTVSDGCVLAAVHSVHWRDSAWCCWVAGDEVLPGDCHISILLLDLVVRCCCIPCCCCYCSRSVVAGIPAAARAAAVVAGSAGSDWSLLSAAVPACCSVSLLVAVTCCCCCCSQSRAGLFPRGCCCCWAAVTLCRH